MPSRARRGLIAATILLVVVVGGALGVRALWNAAKSHFTSEGCTVGSYDVETAQAAIASTMVGVVTRRALPARAAVLVLAAGLQESKLRNLSPGEGDRDSVGVLQQRPSQHWGTTAQLTDVRFATSAFLDALLDVPQWQHLDLAVAVQDVQVSADGSLYGQHESEAKALSDALMGKSARGDHVLVRKAHRGSGRDHRGRAGGQGSFDQHANDGRPVRHRARRVVADGGLVRGERRPARHRQGRLRR